MSQPIVFSEGPYQWRVLINHKVVETWNLAYRSVKDLPVLHNDISSEYHEEEIIYRGRWYIFIRVYYDNEIQVTTNRPRGGNGGDMSL